MFCFNANEVKTIISFILLIPFGISNLFSQEHKSDSLKVESKTFTQDTVPKKNSNFHKKSKKLPLIDAIDANIFLWYGKFNGNLSNYFTDPVFLGLNIDIYKNRVLYQIDDMVALGTTLTKKTMTFPSQLEWKKGTSSECVTGGINIGYEIIDNKLFTIVPLVGLGIFGLSSGNANNIDNEPTNWSYKVGFFVDCKSLALSRKNTSDGYYCIRFSVGLTSPINHTIYPEYYQGSMMTFSIGIMGRGNIKHKTNNKNAT